MIRLSINNFWPNFNYNENIFISILSEIYGNDLILTNDVNDCNLCIVAENYVPPEIDRSKTKILTFSSLKYFRFRFSVMIAIINTYF